MSLPTRSRQIELASRPTGAPTAANFRLTEVDVPEIGDGQLLVRNEVMSVDPYMRGRMNDVKSYVPPFRIDAPLQGHAVGTVLASRVDGIDEGDSVQHMAGWRDVAVISGERARVVDTEAFPASTYLGVLGMPGLTAYSGLMAAGEFKPGDAVFVSGAAGAVGSLVGQIARLSGASRVVGSAGSAEKVTRLKELGFDAAFNYKDGPVTEQLKQAAPDGIDVYFDNVGGDHLEAAIARMNVDGHIAFCGAISMYNSTEAPCAPRNLAMLIGKRITLRGFVVAKYESMQREFVETVGPWLKDGSIKWDETFRDGIENAPQAFMDLLGGANTGKMIVRV